ncbi:MAG: hypothetical protein CHACPFDD_00767 [Phycisphaerae bacterium]|nr:hypothetical protein [Phycisphaerae bacterium]
MTIRWILVAALASVLLVLGGCPAPNGDNSNDNSSDNSNSNDNSSSDTLFDSDRAAINSVTGMLEALGSVLGTFAELENSRLDLASIGQIDVFGQCPRVSLVSNATTAVITFDYTTAGCSGPATAGQTVNGGVQVNATRASGALTITLLNLKVNGHEVSGGFTLTLTRGDDGIELAGAITSQLIIADVGIFEGDLSAFVDANRRLTLDSPELKLTNPDDDEFLVTIAGLVLDPTGNDNFLPEDGDIEFEVGNLDRVVLTVQFDEDSPSSGDVLVRIDDGPPLSHTIP